MHKKITAILLTISCICASFMLTGCPTSEEHAGKINQQVNTKKQEESIQQLDEVKTKYEVLKSSIPDECDRYEKKRISEEYKTLATEIDEIPLQDLDEVKEFSDTFYYEAGMWELNAWGDEEALSYFQKCSPESSGYNLYLIGDMLLNGDKIKGAELLVDQLGTDMETIDTFYSSYSGLNENDQKLDGSIKLAKSASIIGNHISGKSASGNWVNQTDYKLVRTGIERSPGNYVLSNSERNNLQRQCGKEPNKKILVLHKRYIYGTDRTELDLHINLMEYIPPEYLPETLAEVEYVIVVEGNYKNCGKYNVGTTAISENATITAYKVGEADPIYTSETITEPASQVMQYYGDTPPEYYSGGYPDGSAIIKQCLNRILDDISQ